MRLNPAAAFFCGLLMLSLSHADAEQTKICGLVIPKPSGEELMAGNGNINNRSLSVWKWIRHTSAHRIPSVMYEARCESRHCTYPHSRRDAELNAVPVYSSTLVLTQDPTHRTCFTVKLQKVPVGCTCVWARSAP